MCTRNTWTSVSTVPSRERRLQRKLLPDFTYLRVQTVFSSKHSSAPPNLSPFKKLGKHPYLGTESHYNAADAHGFIKLAPGSHAETKESATSTFFSFPETWLGKRWYDSFARAAMTAWILRGLMRVMSLVPSHLIPCHLTVSFVHSLECC